MSQSLQELQLDTRKTGEQASVTLPTPSATSMETSAPTTSVSESASSTPSSSVQDRAKKRPHKTQADTEESDKHIRSNAGSDIIDVESIEVDHIEATSHGDHEQGDVEGGKDQSDAILSCAIRDLASKWPPCTVKVKVKAKTKSKARDMKARLTMGCDTIFESSSDEITHYLEHFTMTGPYLECPISTCRMVFVLESQLEEHKAAYHTKTSTLPPPPPSPKSKQTKNSSTEVTDTASIKGESSQPRVTRSQAKSPATTSTSRLKSRKAEKENPVDDEIDFSDVPLKLLGPFKK